MLRAVGCRPRRLRGLRRAVGAATGVGLGCAAALLAAAHPAHAWFGLGKKNVTGRAEAEHAMAGARLGRTAEETIGHLQKVVASPPDTLPQVTMAEAWCALGLVLLDTGQVQKAEDALKKGLSLIPDPDTPFAQLNLVCFKLGELLMRQKNYAEALELLRRSTLAPEKDETASKSELDFIAQAHAFAALCCRQLRMGDDMLMHLEQACVCAPKDPSYHYILGTTLLNMQKPRKARVALSKAAKLGHPEAMNQWSVAEEAIQEEERFSIPPLKRQGFFGRESRPGIPPMFGGPARAPTTHDEDDEPTHEDDPYAESVSMGSWPGKR